MNLYFLIYIAVIIYITIPICKIIWNDFVYESELTNIANTFNCNHTKGLNIFIAEYKKEIKNESNSQKIDNSLSHLDMSRLDKKSREILEDAIKEYSGAVVCVSHDRFFIDKCADKILGFKDRNAILYDTYSYYRKACQTVPALEPVQSSEVKEENENTTRNANRALGRKEAAKRRQRIADIEKETSKLEAEQKELEAKFSGSCSEEDVKRYGEIAQLLSDLYDEYFELND